MTQEEMLLTYVEHSLDVKSTAIGSMVDSIWLLVVGYHIGLVFEENEEMFAGSFESACRVVKLVRLGLQRLNTQSV